MSRSREGQSAKTLFAPNDQSIHFGPSRFRADAGVPHYEAATGSSEAKLLEKVRPLLPKLPGVYGMWDARNRVIYVGKAKNLRSRLLSYFRVNSRDPKAGKILRHTRRLIWEPATDEFGAFLRELELIRRFTPRFNVLGQPGRRHFYYLCVGRKPAPYLYITRSPTGKELASYGPLTSRNRAEDAVRRVNDAFGLRDCSNRIPLRFTDQLSLFVQPDEERPVAARCLRYDLGTCLGPCVGGCSSRTYTSRVRALKALLDGRDLGLLLQWEKKMQTAAEQFQYETASAYRDKLQSVQWLLERLAFLRTARRANSFVYAVGVGEEKSVWYCIHQGEVRDVISPGTTPAERQRQAKHLSKLFAQPAVLAEIDYRCVDSVLLVNAWFKKYPAERQRLLSVEEATALLKAPTPA